MLCVIGVFDLRIDYCDENPSTSSATIGTEVLRKNQTRELTGEPLKEPFICLVVSLELARTDQI